MFVDKLRSENLVNLLSCPQCGGHHFNLNLVQFQCNSCLISYSIFDNRHFANNPLDTKSIPLSHIKSYQLWLPLNLSKQLNKKEHW